MSVQCKMKFSINNCFLIVIWIYFFQEGEHPTVGNQTFFLTPQDLAENEYAENESMEDNIEINDDQIQSSANHDDPLEFIDVNQDIKSEPIEMKEEPEDY